MTPPHGDAFKIILLRNILIAQGEYMKVAASIFLIFVVTALNSAYAECSAEWKTCRRSALEVKKQCLAGCNASNSGCASACESTLKSSFDACDIEREQCLSAAPGTAGGTTGASAESNAALERTNTCTTAFGTCELSSSTPKGSRCSCATSTGRLSGVAR